MVNDLFAAIVKWASVRSASYQSLVSLTIRSFSSLFASSAFSPLMQQYAINPMGSNTPTSTRRIVTIAILD